MNGRTDVVDDARQRQLGRACAATDRVGGFEHEHRAASAGKRCGGGKAVRAGTDDDGIIGGALPTSALGLILLRIHLRLVYAAQHLSRLECDLVIVAGALVPGDLGLVAVGRNRQDPAERLGRGLELAERDELASLECLIHSDTFPSAGRVQRGRQRGTDLVGAYKIKATFKERSARGCTSSRWPLWRYAIIHEAARGLAADRDDATRGGHEDREPGRK